MKKIIALLLAVLMVATLFAGCANGKDEVVTLKWVTVGGGMPANYEAWQENINKYLEEKIGVHLDVEVISWGDWDQRRNLIVSTGEEYDIMFTNNGTYANDVNMGAFLDITEMVKTSAPELVKFVPEAYWNACKIDGKLYAVPTYKDSSATQYFCWDKAKVEASFPEYADAHSLADIDEGIRKVSADNNEPIFYLSKGGFDLIPRLYDDLSAGLPALGVSYDDASVTVVPVLEQANVQDELSYVRAWYNDGIINSDAAILAENPSYRPMFVAQGWPMAAQTSWGPGMGVEAVAVQYGDTVLSNSTVQGSMNCISAASKNPEKALELLQLVNTDSYVRDALYFGLEGDNFTYTEDGKVHKNNNDWTMAGYTQGTFFIVSMQDTETANQWDEVKALNEQAKPSPALGFNFNTAPVADELAACKAIWEENKAQLMTGSADPETLIPEIMQQMRDSGFDKIIAEAQAQIDAWKK